MIIVAIPLQKISLKYTETHSVMFTLICISDIVYYSKMGHNYCVQRLS